MDSGCRAGSSGVVAGLDSFPNKYGDYISSTIVVLAVRDDGLVELVNCIGVKETGERGGQRRWHRVLGQEKLDNAGRKRVTDGEG